MNHPQSRSTVPESQIHDLPTSSFSFPPLKRIAIIPSLVTAAVAIGGCLMAWWLVPAEITLVKTHIEGFPNAHAPSHQLRPVIIVALCALPTVGMIGYRCGGTMDRYMVREFFSIFGITLSSLFLIFILVDINDNLSEFRDSDQMLATMGSFYFSRSPSIILTLLPYSLLLALIYTLSKLSKEREFIAMIQSGRSILRITLPLLIAGIFAALFCTGLNYHWAPVAEGNRDAILKRARGLPVSQASDVLYYNMRDNRLWMIGMFPENYNQGEPLIDVEITSIHPDHSINTRLNAKQAHWDRNSRVWSFHGVTISTYHPQEPPTFETFSEPVAFHDWEESPFQLIRPGLRPSHLGIPALSGWLGNRQSSHPSHSLSAYRTQWHYRWALPFTCIVTVLLATPLSIHFSRRGPGGGIFLAVVLSALLMVFSNITLALGESDTIPAMLSAWLPNFFFTVVGLYLYQRRISGRPIIQEIRRLLPIT